MKKITLLCFLIATSFAFSQTWTTGTIDLIPGNFTVKFDITSTTVTVTMIGPDNVGFAVSPTNDSYSGGGGMAQFGGDDVIFYANGAITDRQQAGFNGQPGLDATQNNWSISSNTTSGGSRTVVASRARNTGDVNDFIFPASVDSFTVIWARGGNTNFTFHNSRGGAVANTVLSNEDFQLNPARFTISPNPSANDLNIGILYDASRDYNLEVYDVLGKQIYRGQLTKDDSSIDVRNWRRGVYLVKLSSDQSTQTKRFIKQ
ncbi:T9SS type A sorting domain-containing protein [uncultured Winogradskyella sp.]|uniref:T9SS type A sorting domain-containing protein n=1 Tax=uncultured Winogradskyella sp. TaxID=395353 RepID=UPI0026072EF4|nr:T9SS type A sorting domain-containing protein [uncultured Winogradskyella sp.]